MLDHPALASCDTSGLRIAATGAARVPPELVTEIGDRLGCPVVVRYASTEASLATGTRLGDPVDVICTTVGRPSGGVELRVVGDDGSVAPPGAVGTIRLRSRAMMRGYWNDPEQTAAAIDARAGFAPAISAGSATTATCASPAAPARCTSAAATTSIRSRSRTASAPTRRWRHRRSSGPTSTTVSARSACCSRCRRGGFAVELDDVRSFVAERLAGYKAPDILVLVESLPLTTIGKVDKLALREQADQEAARWRRVPT